MTARATRACRWLVAMAIAAAPARLAAHSGPPFPILSDRAAGPYVVSIWTDPDATDDRSPGGKFWIMLAPAGAGSIVPPGTRVDVVIRPRDRQDGQQIGHAEPVNGDRSRQFVALVMDHEGPFDVRVAIDGPLGAAGVEAAADATYDLRPRPILIALFVLPFVLAGFVWGKLLVKRRMHRPGGR